MHKILGKLQCKVCVICELTKLLKGDIIENSARGASARAAKRKEGGFLRPFITYYTTVKGFVNPFLQTFCHFLNKIFVVIITKNSFDYRTFFLIV